MHACDILRAKDAANCSFHIQFVAVFDALRVNRLLFAQPFLFHLVHCILSFLPFIQFCSHTHSTNTNKIARWIKSVYNRTRTDLGLFTLCLVHYYNYSVNVSRVEEYKIWIQWTEQKWEGHFYLCNATTTWNWSKKRSRKMYKATRWAWADVTIYHDITWQISRKFSIHISSCYRMKHRYIGSSLRWIRIF